MLKIDTHSQRVSHGDALINITLLNASCHNLVTLLAVGTFSSCSLSSFFVLPQWD